MESRKVLGTLTAVGLMAWGISASAGTVVNGTCSTDSPSTNPDATLTNAIDCGSGPAGDKNDSVGEIGTILGDFINRHVQQVLVINGTADARTSLPPAPLMEPTVPAS